ncbi:hypothetical protein AVEN_151290-1 [Araneus ventricosus]|uniref:Uncharacterized protein n=1 Tax=Araneus ventricosus TaxID=182803 RepID=A0A4Y2PHI4_ARAVE|nr:hypothetical protein AVEN_151290-1 [Araneus ventricosus]
MCHTSVHWLSALPAVLRGLRTVFKEDLQCSPTEIVYGENLCLPSQFFVQQQPQAADNGFIKKLKAHIQQLQATPTSNHSAKPTFVYRDLSVCSHVFLRVDAVQPSLSQPYTGPYKVLSRTNKNFIILKDNKKVTVTIDRLKPAHLLLYNVNSSESKLESPRVDTSSTTPSAKEPEKSAMPLPEKSSMLLRQMQDLAGNRVGDELLRSLWLQRLPTQMQAILTTSSDDLNKLSIMADKIADVTSGNEICSTHVKTKVPETRIPNDCISNLQAQIRELSLKIDRMSQFRRSKSMSRRNNSRARSASRKDQWLGSSARNRKVPVSIPPPNVLHIEITTDVNTLNDRIFNELTDLDFEEQLLSSETEIDENETNQQNHTLGTHPISSNANIAVLSSASFNDSSAALPSELQQAINQRLADLPTNNCQMSSSSHNINLNALSLNCLPQPSFHFLSKDIEDTVKKI